MAIIKPSPLVSSIRGRIGNVVFRRKGNRTVASNMPITVHNPSTRNQSIVRSIFSMLKKAWDRLNIDQHAVWNEYAQGLLTSQQKLGTDGIIKTQGRYMTGYNAFLGINTRLKHLNQSFVLVPPNQNIPGPTEIKFSERGIFAGVSIDVVIDSLTPIGSIVRLWIKGNWNGGHSYMAMKKSITQNDITAGFIQFFVRTIRTGSVRDYADVPYGFFTDEKVNFQADIIGLNGYKSPNSNIISEIINSDVPDSLSNLYQLTSAGYKANMVNYADEIGIPGTTPASYFSQMIVNFCISNDLDYKDILTIQDMTEAGIPATIALEVDGGYLPPTDKSSEYISPFS